MYSFMANIFSPCGIVCDDCDWFKGEKEPVCPGCTELEGKPFWGECETYSCVEDKQVDHCGECVEFPCTDFMGRYDPDEGPLNVVIRAGILAYRKQHGDEKAVELGRSVER